MTAMDDLERPALADLGMVDSLHVPRERYYDRAFFEMEKERLWPYVWQMACRLEEIPRSGDFVEYEICDQSVLVVRQPDRSIKAFHNACRHRATQLAKGAGRLGGGQIVCPFHGWRWDLDGTNSFVYAPEAFAPECLRPDDLALRPCLTDVWGGCVWINMDLDARPPRDALSPVPELLDPLGVENMRVWWWKETILDANWKMAQEAFLEGYHTMRTHPQLTMGLGEDWNAASLAYTAFAHGHARFELGPADGADGSIDADTFLEMNRILCEGQDAMTLERDLRVFERARQTVPAGADFAPAAIGALYEDAARCRIPLPAPTEAMSLWGGEVFSFPNYFMLPQYGNSLAYRIRPYGDDPERCRFEVWSLTMYPEGEEPGRAELRGRYAPDDSENWGLIPLQDFSNIERQQRGLHSRSFTQLRLATQWERGISNMHEELDRYLQRSR